MAEQALTRESGEIPIDIDSEPKDQIALQRLLNEATNSGNLQRVGQALAQFKKAGFSLSILAEAELLGTAYTKHAANEQTAAATETNPTNKGIHNANAGQALIRAQGLIQAAANYRNVPQSNIK